MYCCVTKNGMPSIGFCAAGALSLSVMVTVLVRRSHACAEASSA